MLAVPVQVNLIKTHDIAVGYERTAEVLPPANVANVVIDGTGEDEWVGSTVRVGEVTLDVVKQIDRCVMTTRTQPGGIDRDVDVLRTIIRERANNLGIGSLVRKPGMVHVGDAVEPVSSF